MLALQREMHAWRERLAQEIKDPTRRAQLALLLGINPTTLRRWSQGTSTPRSGQMTRLLSALETLPEPDALQQSEYREILLDFTGIPDTQLYAQILKLYCTTAPSLRSLPISQLLLHYILTRLAPSARGILVFLVQCVPPGSDGIVRSMRKTMAKGSGIWEHSIDQQDIEQQTQFFGAESQTGHTVMQGHSVVFQTHEEKARQFPTQQHMEEESTLTLPIMLHDRVAGCLCLVSSKSHAFPASQQTFFLHIARLFALAYQTEEFYSIKHVQLGVMPGWKEQLPHLASFQQRMQKLLRHDARQEQRPTWKQTEQRLWKMYEEDFLHLALEVENTQ